MKTASQNIIDAESAEGLQPAETFHLWTDAGEHWRYTSLDADIDVGGDTYSHQKIKRREVEWSADLQASRVSVDFPADVDWAAGFAATHPHAVIYLEISRLHLDVVPYETVSAFYGFFTSPRFAGPKLTANFSSWEALLNQMWPPASYQPGCNHRLGDSRCGLDVPASWTDTVTVTSVSADGLELTGNFSARTDGWYTLGVVTYGVHRRVIVDHAGDVIKLRYPLPVDVTGLDVDAASGCDGDMGTCHSKLNNITKFLGHPYVPLKNPTLTIYT